MDQRFDQMLHAILEATRFAHDKKTHAQAHKHLKEAISLADAHARELLVKEGSKSASQFRHEFQAHVNRIGEIMHAKGGKKPELKKGDGCAHETLLKGESCQKCSYMQKSQSILEETEAGLYKSMAHFAATDYQKAELLAKAKLLKAKIIDLKSKKVLADLPTDHFAHMKKPQGQLTGIQGGKVETYDEKRMKAGNPSLLETYRARFGPTWNKSGVGKFIEHHHTHGHDEPYVGGDSANVAWRTIEGDKSPKYKGKARWNDPHPFAVPADKVKHGGTIGKGVSQGGPDPLSWMEMKYGTTKQVIQDAKDKPLTIHTRSDLIAHDDYMQHLTPGKHKIHMHLFSSNEQVNRMLEPGAPSINRRMEAAKKLRDAGHDVTLVHDRIEGLHGNKLFDLHAGGIQKEHGKFKWATNDVKLTDKSRQRITAALGHDVFDGGKQPPGSSPRGKLKKAKVDEGKSLEEKVKARQERNDRDVKVPKTPSGQDTRTYRSGMKRRGELEGEKPAERRRGEKIVGEQKDLKTEDAGVHMKGGTFARHTSVGGKSSNMAARVNQPGRKGDSWRVGGKVGGKMGAEFAHEDVMDALNPNRHNKKVISVSFGKSLEPGMSYKDLEKKDDDK